MNAQRRPDRPGRPDKPPYFCVYASQLAACINENRHKRPAEAAEIMWERADPDGYHEALRRNGVLTDEEHLQKIEHRYPEVLDMLKTADTSGDTSVEVAGKYSSISSKFCEFAENNKLSPEERRVVDDALRKTSYTTFGNSQEAHVFEYLRDTLGWDCHEDPTFYKVQAGVVQTAWGDFPWFIGGKIDGIARNKSYVVEIKCRVNRLFRRAPVYEAVQIQTYLQLLNIDKGMLVECMFTKNRDADINVVPIARNKDRWDSEFFPKLSRFVEFIVHLVHDHDLQDKFLRSKRRNVLVTNFKPETT